MSYYGPCFLEQHRLILLRQNAAHINPFQPSDAFHIDTSHLICTLNQMTGFYMKYNTGLKWVYSRYLHSAHIALSSK